MKQLVFGDFRIDRIVELEELGYKPTFFYPNANTGGVAAEID